MAQGEKNAAQRGAWIVFVDESGCSLVPAVRRTWAPRGQTPIVRHRMGPRPKVSMASWCCYRPDGSAARLSFHVREGSFNDQALIGVLGRVRRLLGGAAVTLVWDNLPAHHSRRMRAFLAGQGDWLQVEYLPAYAPELNPVEGVWASLKDRELANLGAETLKVLLGAARRGLRRVQRERWLLRGFLEHCGLALG